MTDSEWEERQKTRQLEMEACSKALAIVDTNQGGKMQHVVLSLASLLRSGVDDGAGTIE